MVDIKELIWQKWELKLAYNIVIFVVSYISGCCDFFFGWKNSFLSSSLLLVVSTCVVVDRFDTGKFCLWEITMTPQSLVISCCDMNNNNSGTINLMFVCGHVQFGWMCL